MRKRIFSVLVLLAVFFCIFSIQDVSYAQTQSTREGVDFMIICAHPGDECLFLGGALPLYAGQQGRSAVVVFLSSSSNEQSIAARESLARYGLNVQAVFADFSPVYTSNEEDALRYWDKQAVTTYLVNIIRKYQPVVVLSHDQLGEYGHGAHCVTSDCVLQAVQSAAVETEYPESAEKFGNWQIQRLFLHRYGENLVTLNRSEPLSRFNGLTALELDQQGYAYYPEQYPIKISDDFGYTRAQYGLAYAAASDHFDPSSGDLFVGINPSLLSAAETAAPADSVSPQITEAQAESAGPTDSVTTADDSSGSFAVRSTDERTDTLQFDRIAAIVFGVLALTLIFGVYSAKKREVFHRASLIPIVLTLLAFLFFGCRALWAVVPPRTQAVVADTPAPSASPASTATGEALPSLSPSPESDPNDIYFRSASDPAEVVINDQDNEHWEYRSDTLSVIIDREHILRSDGKPITYCVAQIRMREVDCFQAGIHTASIKSIQRLEPPWYMARRYRAVLAITGDNLTRAETDKKGILIRNGTIYSSNQAQDTLALFPNELSMKIYKQNTITPQELLDLGVVNTFSFGPTLLNNYERDLESKRGNLGRANPRCGIGMVEPGYFIAITVDGRQSKYSVGMTMDGFAQLFYLYGCQLAYNLDGGSSTAMVFMGETLSQHSGEGSDTQRPWTDGLLWGNSELVPTIDDHVYNNGNHPWIPIPE